MSIRTLDSVVSDVRLLSKYLRAYGGGDEVGRQTAKVLNHLPGEMSPLVALHNDATASVERRKDAGELLRLLGRIYRYANPMLTGPGPFEFDPKGAADLLEVLADKLAGVDDDDHPGMWSKAESPTEWGSLFGITSRAFVNRCKEGTIRHKKLSSKSYQVHVDDIPKTKR